MINAKQELLDVLNDMVIVAATIRRESEVVQLKEKHTKREYESFMNKLDFTYDNGSGTQYLYGTIWCTNGTWLEREEYDGSEWWKVIVYPTIPPHLKHF